MKKNIKLIFLFAFVYANAQFSIKIESPKDFIFNEAYLYSINGSKDILLDKTIKSNGLFIFKVKNNYWGMMKVYFPDTNSSISFLSENKNVDIAFTIKNNKVNIVDYKDETNKIFYDIQDQQKKKEQILPALYQIQSYYKINTPFGEALKSEISILNGDVAYDTNKHPFLNYYFNTYQKYLSESVGKKNPTNAEIVNFLNTSQNYLETSSLLRPILVSFLGNSNKANLDAEVDQLLKTVNLETPRGQTILSELIEIFSVYSLKDLKDKYLTEAKKLKCTLNERLSNTLKSNTSLEIGKVIPNTKFNKPVNTKEKSIHDVKARKKIIVFWSSTCPHCEKEIAEMVTRYNELKSKNIEIIGLSLDTEAKSYSDKIKILPWINDTELKGWYSSYVEKYNINATPYFYIVDSENKILQTPDNFSEILEFLSIK